MFDLLLQLVRDVIAVGNVSDARQRRAGCELCIERWQPAHPSQLSPHAYPLPSVVTCKSFMYMIPD